MPGAWTDDNQITCAKHLRAIGREVFANPACSQGDFKKIMTMRRNIIVEIKPIN